MWNPCTFIASNTQKTVPPNLAHYICVDYSIDLEERCSNTAQRHAKAASTPKYVRKPDLVYDIGLMRLYTSIVKSFMW